MKKYITMIGISLGVILASGCVSVNRSAQEHPVGLAVETPTLSVKVDVDSSSRVEGNTSATYLFGLLRLSGPSKYADKISGSSGGKVVQMKNAALYNALDGSGGDRLVDPQYVVEKKSYLFGLITRYNVEVNGFKASVKEVKQVDTTYSVGVNGRMVGVNNFVNTIDSQSSESQKTFAFPWPWRW